MSIDSRWSSRTESSDEATDSTWRLDALCAQTDPEAFFPDKGGSTREAKRICSSCNVKTECLNYALSHAERFGIWGGLSERERRRHRRVVSLPAPRVSQPQRSVIRPAPVTVAHTKATLPRPVVKAAQPADPPPLPVATVKDEIAAPPKRRGPKRRNWVCVSLQTLALQLGRHPSYRDLVTKERTDSDFKLDELFDYWPTMKAAIEEAVGDLELTPHPA